MAKKKHVWVKVPIDAEADSPFLVVSVSQVTGKPDGYSVAAAVLTEKGLPRPSRALTPNEASLAIYGLRGAADLYELRAGLDETNDGIEAFNVD